MKKPKLIGGYQNTKLNKEDFAITPFLFVVCVNLVLISIKGIGICWGHHAVYIGIGFGIPDNYPRFKNLKIKNKKDENIRD